MNAVKKQFWIPGLSLTCALAGEAAWLLRWRLLMAGVDEKGLLLPGQPLATLSWILTGCVIALTLALLWKHRKTEIVIHGSKASDGVRALAMILAAVLFWDETILGKAVAVAAAVTAILSVWSLLGGKKPLAHAMADIPTVLFFILCLLCSYRTWSAEPEIQRYCYRLLALVCLMMAAYQRSAVWLGMGKGSLFLGTGILGVYFAFAAGADPGFTVLFLTLGVWMFAQLGAVTEKEPTDSDNKEAQSVEIQEERE